jgi:hypothetical protein
MERGWDPEVKRYFRKILFSVSFGLLWLMACMASGLYFGLAYREDIALIYHILFYGIALLTLALLVRYYYRTWRK